MGPDFNNDGRVDGYDMEYLGDPDSSGAPASASGGGCCSCLAILGCIIGGIFLASFMFYACVAFASI